MILRIGRPSHRLIGAVLMPVVAILAGCSGTEIGQRQMYVPPISGGVTTQPNAGLAPLTPQPLMGAQTGRLSVPSMYPRNIDQSGASSAVKALYTQAKSDCTRGDFLAASNALERAVQLDPDSAFVWNALATLDLRRKKYQRAETEAGKSSSVANGNPWLDAANWNLIAEARKAQGDLKGALEAHTHAARIMSRLPSGQ